MIYYGDERCLPADDKDRNSIMASNALLSKVGISAANIFTMPTELGAIKAAEKYRVVIADVDQLYDQFAYGVERHFIAFRNFGYWTKEN